MPLEILEGGGRIGESRPVPDRSSIGLAFLPARLCPPFFGEPLVDDSQKVAVAFLRRPVLLAGLVPGMRLQDLVAAKAAATRPVSGFRASIMPDSQSISVP